jgi:hypothetical protein
MTEPVIGAHAGGFNTGSTGISLIGDFTSATPPTGMIQSLQRLLAWKLDVHHIPAVGTIVMTSAGSTKYRPGVKVRLNRISGHRNTSQTGCPGARVYSQLDSIRNNVRKIGLPKLYLPTLSTVVVRPNGDTKDESTTLRATFTQSMHWTAEFRSSNGTLIRTLTGTGSSMAATFDGRTLAGDLGPTGLVRYRITAFVGGVKIRPAEGNMYLVTTHPNGTVLTSPTRTVLLEGGLARLVPTQLVRDSWFRPGEPVAATEAEIDRYPVGAPLPIREGTLLAEPDGSFSIISDGVRRPFDDGVFAALGYTASGALPISQSELHALPSGPKWTDTSRHPAGALVRASDGSEWTLGTLDRRRHKTDLMWKSIYHYGELVTATPGDIALTVGANMTYREGTLFRLPDKTYWIYAAGVKRRFYDATFYGAFGYSSTAPLSTFSTSEAATIPTGPVIG